MTYDKRILGNFHVDPSLLDPINHFHGLYPKKIDVRLSESIDLAKNELTIDWWEAASWIREWLNTGIRPNKILKGNVIRIREKGSKVVSKALSYQESLFDSMRKIMYHSKEDVLFTDQQRADRVRLYYKDLLDFRIQIPQHMKYPGHVIKAKSIVARIMTHEQRNRISRDIDLWEKWSKMENEVWCDKSTLGPKLKLLEFSESDTKIIERIMTRKY